MHIYNITIKFIVGDSFAASEMGDHHVGIRYTVRIYIYYSILLLIIVYCNVEIIIDL